MHLAAALADAQQRLIDLAHELTAKVEAAALWQTRADFLAAQLAAAERRLLELGPGEEAQSHDVPVPTPQPWWAFWCRWRFTLV